jgi:hypothetical protein
LRFTVHALLVEFSGGFNTIRTAILAINGLDGMRGWLSGN